MFGRGIRNPEKFSSWNPEFWGLESGIQLKESSIPLTVGTQNPESRIQVPLTKIWNLVTGIGNPGRGIQNPDSLTWGEWMEFQNYTILKMTVRWLVSSSFLSLSLSSSEAAAAAITTWTFFFSNWTLVHLADSSRIQCIYVDTNYACIVLLRAISKVLAEPYLEIVIYCSG